MATDLATEFDMPTASTAPPAVATKPQDTDTAAAEETAGEAAAAKASPEIGFGGLSKEFLMAMQDALEDLGLDLSSADIMQELAGDQSLPGQLMERLLQSARATGVKDPAVLREMVRQWQQAIKEQMEEEKRLAKKKKRPVWRCAVCGRYGCPVAPYIERYDEVDV
jgi:rubrerythrin